MSLMPPNVSAYMPPVQPQGFVVTQPVTPYLSAVPLQVRRVLPPNPDAELMILQNRWFPRQTFNTKAPPKDQLASPWLGL